MAPPSLLSEHELGFVEAVGHHVETFGLPRIAGRCFGLLLVAPRPLALEEIADILRVSRASVSINTRIGIALGVFAVSTEPGDRRKYYVFADDAFEHRIALLSRHFTGVKRILREGITGLSESNRAARVRLETAEHIVTLMHAKVEELVPLVAEHAQRKRPS